MGYTLDETKGHHHRIFGKSALVNSPDYARFWDSLRAGEFMSSVIERVDKSGQAVRLQASYNPIINDDGRVFKVVKLATNVTQDINDTERRKHVQPDISGDIITINDAAQGATSQAENAVNAARDASEQVQAVASAAEGMAASVAEIGGQVNRARTVTTDAIEQAHLTTKIVSGLANAAEEIGNVTALIDEIAEQTNLLEQIQPKPNRF